jgi:hypothetical protein
MEADGMIKDELKELIWDFSRKDGEREKLSEKSAFNKLLLTVQRIFILIRKVLVKESVK